MSTKGGTGSGYASMLSLRKQTTPAATTNTMRATTSIRCRRAAPMSQFMMASFLASHTMPSPAPRGAIDEQGSVGHYHVTGRNAFGHLDHLVAGSASSYLARNDRICARQYPHSCCVSLVDNR